MQSRRFPVEEFQQLPLQAHRLMAGVPLQDVTVIELPGGGDGRTIAELRALQEGGARGGLLSRLLFGLRSLLGRLFGWDSPRHDEPTLSYRQRVPADLVARSRQAPGAPAGAFHYLYELDDEALLEIRNGTVHAFLCTVLRPHGPGYRLYWAVYVQPVSWATPFYMALIEPFRRYIVYPSLFRSLARAWRRAYATGARSIDEARDRA